MKNHDTFASFLDACAGSGLTAPVLDWSALPPAAVLAAPRSQWRLLAAAAHAAGMRWCGFWALETGRDIEAFCCYEQAGAYLIMRSRFKPDEALPSIAPVYPAADRPERHAHDLLGVRFADQPDNRRWTRHQAWGEAQYPLLTDFQAPAADTPTPADHAYPFLQSPSQGVVEIPVGPVHAGIIEPGHFRFQAVGEIVLNLEERLGYVHKGIEKLAVGRNAAGLARLAGRVSGDSTVSHAWAACQAMERAAGVTPPERASWLRAIMTERERIANHLGDIGAICNDVGFSFAQAQLTRLKEGWIRENGKIFGHRLLMDRVIPGGTSVDIAAATARELAASAARLALEVGEIIGLLEDSESLEDRLMGTGRLTPEDAGRLGALGFVGRASGQSFDVRRDAPYAPYDRFDLPVPGYRAGDVAARAKVRADETLNSAKLICELLDSLPEGPHSLDWREPRQGCEGMGFIEGWRGEIMTYVRFGDDGKVARFYPRDPSWLTWPALELLIQDNIVPDFPVCNKSVNGSYSGHDL